MLQIGALVLVGRLVSSIPCTRSCSKFCTFFSVRWHHTIHSNRCYGNNIQKKHTEKASWWGTWYTTLVEAFWYGQTAPCFINPGQYIWEYLSYDIRPDSRSVQQSPFLLNMSLSSFSDDSIMVFLLNNYNTSLLKVLFKKTNFKSRWLLEHENLSKVGKFIGKFIYPLLIKMGKLFEFFSDFEDILDLFARNMWKCSRRNG